MSTKSGIDRHGERFRPRAHGKWRTNFDDDRRISGADERQTAVAHGGRSINEQRRPSGRAWFPTALFRSTQLPVSIGDLEFFDPCFGDDSGVLLVTQAG